MMNTSMRLLVAAFLAAVPAAAVAQKIESIQIVPPKKGKDRIVPTVKPDAIAAQDEKVEGSGSALRCPGNGYATGAAKKDVATSGQDWLDRINSDTDGFSGEALIETGSAPRVHPPRGLHAAAWVPLKLLKNEGDWTLVGSGEGGVRVQYNRYSGDIVVRTPAGRFVGICRR